MKMMKTVLFLFTLLFSTLIYQSCVEQVEAEFDLQADIIFVDAYALTEPGTSSVTISKSAFGTYSNYKVLNLSNARVNIENSNTGELVTFLEDSSGVYKSPPNFAAAIGEEWKLNIELANGKKIESQIQTVTAPISIDDIQTTYAPEIEFDPQFDRFVPGHRLSISWQDPAEEENFYLWKYKTFEQLFVCKTCHKGVFRNGECVPTGIAWGPNYYSYKCLPQCWQIELGKELPVFDDRLEDGAKIIDRAISIFPFYRQTNILIEIQQLSLDKAAYEYFKVINSQIAESEGLNAPPPAALLGNLMNPEDPSDLILGHFTAAGVSTKRVFIDRSRIAESPVSPNDLIILEDCIGCPTTFPCEESSTRTAIKPVGWP